MLSHFSLTAIDSHRTLHLVLMHSAAASIWAVTKFSYLSISISFRYLLKSIKLVSYSNHILIAYITIGK